SLARKAKSDAVYRPPTQQQWAPARYGGAGPCFAARETSGMLQMISRRRKRLAFASAAKHGDQRLYERPSALACRAATALRPWSRQGHSLWSGGVMATPSFCRAF